MCPFNKNINFMLIVAYYLNILFFLQYYFILKYLIKHYLLSISYKLLSNIIYFLKLHARLSKKSLFVHSKVLLYLIKLVFGNFNLYLFCFKLIITFILSKILYSFIFSKWIFVS